MSNSNVPIIDSSAAAPVTYSKYRIDNPNPSADWIDCKWAIEYPDIQKACHLQRACVSIPPKSCRFKDVRSILQEGPTCGLTALSMCSGGQLSIPSLLEIARDRRYTRNGEMFSARNLYELTEMVLTANDDETNENDKSFSNIETTNSDRSIRCRLFQGNLYCDEIKNALRNGDCLLVPYDPDFNHGPCLRKGRKAHWALIIGFLIDNNDKFFVFSRHGKTRNIAIWSLKSLSVSNSQLVEFEQPKGYPDVEFILPDGGIGGKLGLKSQCIIIENIEANEIVIR